jgi:hypothetical protein
LVDEDVLSITPCVHGKGIEKIDNSVPIPAAVSEVCSHHDDGTKIKKVDLPCGFVPPEASSFHPLPPFHFDPTDNVKEVFGHAVQNLLSVPSLSISSTAEDLLAHLTYREITGYDDYDGFYDGYPVLDPWETQPENDFFGFLCDKHKDVFDSRVFAVASWHRVLHKNLEPSQVRPYLGYAPLRVIARTLARTTQMAKMIIRAPLRRHIKSRLSFMSAKRLEETVSTDPMFANCMG